MKKDEMIRPACAKDLPQLTHWMQCLKVHTETATQDVYLQAVGETQLVYFAKMFERALGADDQKILIAEKEGEAIGFILGRLATAPFQPSDIQQIGEIDLCWVDPMYRRQGIGRLLVHALEDWFLKRGLRFIDLHYLIGNVEAEESWTRLGYRPYRVTARKAV